VRGIDDAMLAAAGDKNEAAGFNFLHGFSNRDLALSDNDNPVFLAMVMGLKAQLGLGIDFHDFRLGIGIQESGLVIAPRPVEDLVINHRVIHIQEIVMTVKGPVFQQQRLQIVARDDIGQASLTVQNRQELDLAVLEQLHTDANIFVFNNFGKGPVVAVRNRGLDGESRNESATDVAVSQGSDHSLIGIDDN